MKEHKCKSGETLKIGVVPFRDAKGLFDAVSKEVKASKWDPSQQVDVNFIKDTALALISSEAVEKSLWVCMSRSMYKGLKITEETFEDVKAREDFLEVCYEVAKETLAPFMKNLFAELQPLLELVTQKSQQ